MFYGFLLLFDRLDAIACDAELQEKSESDLQRLADVLTKGCEQAMEEVRNKTEAENNEGQSLKGSL